MPQETKTRREQREQDAQAKAQTVKPTKERVGEIDALLDEIDTVLEDACVATTYRQKPGQ